MAPRCHRSARTRQAAPFDIAFERHLAHETIGEQAVEVFIARFSKVFGHGLAGFPLNADYPHVAVVLILAQGAVLATGEALEVADDCVQVFAQLLRAAVGCVNSDRIAGFLVFRGHAGSPSHRDRSQPLPY